MNGLLKTEILLVLQLDKKVLYCMFKKSIIIVFLLIISDLLSAQTEYKVFRYANDSISSEGTMYNGKPDGYGTMTFRSANRIDSRDDQGRIAQRGDKVRGNYIDGHLEYGTWMKSDGSKEEIFIGQ